MYAPILENDHNLLLFSTRQGRQTNCLISVEVARLIAERLWLRLVLPPCRTSPLGEHACAFKPKVPPNAHALVHLELQRVLQARDLARCRLPQGSTSMLLTPSTVPLSAEPINVTCLVVIPSGGSPRAEQDLCTKEYRLDDALSSALTVRFTRFVSVSASEFSRATAASAGAALRARVLGPHWQRQSVFVHEPMLTAVGAFSRRPMHQCILPRTTETVVRMAHGLERALNLTRRSTLCVHWRGKSPALPRDRYGCAEGARSARGNTPRLT
jgi:hypothetical protein